MERWNKQENAEIEDILHEVKKSRRKSDAKVDNEKVDELLAALGVGIAHKMEESAQTCATPPEEENLAKTTEFKLAGQKPSKEADVSKTAVFDAPGGENKKDEKDEPDTEPADKTDSLFAHRKKHTKNTTIWDVEVEHSAAMPRVGKAAALDKVESGKYLSDTELLSWFSEEDTQPEERPLSRKEKKRLAREEKNRLKQLRKEERMRQKYEDIAQEEEDLPEEPAFFEEEAPAAIEDTDTIGLFADREMQQLDELDATGENLNAYNPPPAPKQQAAVNVEDFFEDATIEFPLNDVKQYPEASEDIKANFLAAATVDPELAESFFNMPVQKQAPPAEKSAPAPKAPPKEEEKPKEKKRNLFGHKEKDEKPTPPQKEAPALWDAVDADDIVTGSAFDEGPCDDHWPEEGSLFDKPQPPAAPAATGQPKQGTGWRGTPLGEVKLGGLPENFIPQPGFTQEHIWVKPEVGTATPEVRSKLSVEFTQEFTIAEEDASLYLPPDELTTRSLFVEEMVDDRFREFFSETVIVEREDIGSEAREKRRQRKLKKRKKNTSFATGEFAQLAAEEEAPPVLEEEFFEEAYEEPLLEEETIEEYNCPQDAESVAQNLAALQKNFLMRGVITGGIALVLLYLSFAAGAGRGLPNFLSPVQTPLAFTIVHLVLIVAAVVLNFTTFASGLAGLIKNPTPDSTPALAALAASLQGVMALVQVFMQKPLDVTLFGGVAALLLAGNALGKYLRARSVLANFYLTSAGLDHSAAYVLDAGHDAAYTVTKGLAEDDPTLLISRPTALVKGFMKQSFSERWSDRLGRPLGWVLLIVALIGGIVTYFISKEPLVAVSAFAGALCIGAPLSSSLVSAVPSWLLQKGTGKVGAVVPGWSAIEELGEVNTVMVEAKDIFPPQAVQLHGIKTFDKQRIDLAILYAASVLAEGCETLRDVFMAVVQGRSDILYKVESLTYEQNRGFTAWVNNSRVVVGTREMLQKHGIEPPALELELKYATEGRMPVYLAVSGELFAMFIISYEPDEEVEATLYGLIKSGVSLLVTSTDMNITSNLIETVYQLPEGVVKVLNQHELEALEPLTEYRDESDGVMTHIGTFASFIGGMRAAAGCAASERMAGILQIAAVVLASFLSLLLTFSGGLAGLALLPVVTYQIAWTLMVGAIPLARRY